MSWIRNLRHLTRYNNRETDTLPIEDIIILLDNIIRDRILASN